MTDSALSLWWWQVDSEVLQTSGEGEAVVGVWVRESPHNYENNSRINEVGLHHPLHCHCDE